MVNFVEELRSMKICEHLNQNVNENPEDNYCRFTRLVNSAKEKHLQPKIVKYNKTRHKKSCWMSYGILESINTKNRLYKRFIQTDKNNVALFDTLKAEYHIYRARLRRTIREAKRMFYVNNKVIRIFNHCTVDVKLLLIKSYCTSFYCGYLWSDYKAKTFSKLRVAFNNVYRKILGLPTWSSASEMYATYNIENFKALLRKAIYGFIQRLEDSSNVIV